MDNRGRGAVVPIASYAVVVGGNGGTVSNSQLPNGHCAVHAIGARTAPGSHHFTRSDAEKVEAGQCVAVGGGRTDAKVDITDCAAKCPQGDYASMWQTGSGGYALCLQLNVHRGDCIAKSFDNTTKVACGAQATHRVTDILTGTTSDAGCGDEATSYPTYSKPEPLVVCLAKAGR